MRRNLKALLIPMIIMFAVTVSFAQDGGAAKDESKVDISQTDPGSEYSEADRPEENYLAEFHARDRCEYLIKHNLEEIFTLKVIMENFKKDFSDWEKMYTDVYEGYKKGVDLYYRRDLIYAAVKLEYNKKKINEFYKEISDKYREQCLTMLNLGATNILDLTLDSRTKSDPNKNRKLFNNKMRLRVAYSNMDDAEKARLDRNYSLSIFHYRIAKMYAISILENLDPKQYRNKYDVHKADNKNRIWVAKETTAEEFKDEKKDQE